MQVLFITVHVRQHNLFYDRCSSANSKVLGSQLLSPILIVSNPCLEQSCSQQTGANCCTMKSGEKKNNNKNTATNKTPLPHRLLDHPSSNTFASVRSNYGKCFTWEGPKKTSAASQLDDTESVGSTGATYEGIDTKFQSSGEHLLLISASHCFQDQLSPTQSLEHTSFMQNLRLRFSKHM